MRKASRKRSTLPLLPSQIEIPPAAQLTSGKAIRGEWRDPTDATPSAARTARMIKGWRGGDPLRACRQRHGEACGITERHILAADRLRSYADGAAIGFSNERDLSLPVKRIIYRPSAGPGLAALRQARCWRNFVRAMAVFTREQRQFLTFVLLLNRAPAQWVKERRAAGLSCNPGWAMGQLIALLDQLEAHLSSEIDADIARGIAA
jgi:hypothetical protein